MKYYTKEWYEYVQKSGGNKELSDPLHDRPDEYAKVLQEQQIPEILLDKLDFHDSELLDMREEGDTLVLQMEDRGVGWPRSITLKRPRILKQDGALTASDWLHEELYRTKDGYELHILFCNWRNEDQPHLAELTVRCDEIEIM